MRVRHIIRTVVVPDNRYVLRHATSVTVQFLDAATSQHIVLAYHCVECSTVIEQQTGSGAPPFRFPWTEPRFASQL